SRKPGPWRPLQRKTIAFCRLRRQSGRPGIDQRRKRRLLTRRGQRCKTPLAFATFALGLLAFFALTRASELPTHAVSLGCPLRHALKRNDKADNRQQRPKHPQGKVECSEREQNGTAAGQLEN